MLKIKNNLRNLRIITINLGIICLVFLATNIQVSANFETVYNQISEVNSINQNGNIYEIDLNKNPIDNPEIMDKIDLLINPEENDVEYKFSLNGKDIKKIYDEDQISKINSGKISKLNLAPLNQNDHIVLSPGHGWFYSNVLGRWALQRGYHFGIVEDFINHDFITEIQGMISPSFSIAESTREMNRSAGNHPSGYPMWQMSATEYLKSEGYPESVWNDSGINPDVEISLAKDIRARGLYANYVEADILVSLHNNGGGGCGSETWYDTINGYRRQSKELARLIQGRLIHKLKTEWSSSWCDRGLKGAPGSYGENRIFEGPAALIEVGYMDNSSDNSALQNSTFRNLANQAIADAILDYQKLPKTQITSPLTYSSPDNYAVEISGDALAYTGSNITKVEFYVNGVKVGEDNTEPYSYTWNGWNGEHELHTLAIDDLGREGWSQDVTLYLGQCFSDVPTDSSFHPFICNLKRDSIISGQAKEGSLYFNPTRNISRGEMAKIVKGAFNFNTNTSCADFSDLKPGQPFYEEATTLKCAGVISGSGGKFNSTKNLTRAEAMVFVMNSRLIQNGEPLDIDPGFAGFADVKNSSVFYPYIYSAASDGIISGQNISGNLYFRPANQITRAELAKIVDGAR